MNNLDPRLILAAGLFATVGGLAALVGALVNNGPVYEFIVAVGLLLLGFAYVLKWWGIRSGRIGKR